MIIDERYPLPIDTHTPQLQIWRGCDENTICEVVGGGYVSRVSANFTTPRGGCLTISAMECNVCQFDRSVLSVKLDPDEEVVMCHFNEVGDRDV